MSSHTIRLSEDREMAGIDGMVLVVLVVFYLALSQLVVNAANLTTCSFPAVYGFGDSMIDVGNSIQAFPHQFAYAESTPNGEYWPMHSADRMCDGKLLVDFICKRFTQTNVVL